LPREERDSNTARTHLATAHSASFAACITVVIIGVTIIVFPEIWEPVYHAQPLIATVPFLLLAASLIWLGAVLGCAPKQQASPDQDFQN